MEEEVRRGDLRAGARASVCRPIVMRMITPPTQPAALSVDAEAANPRFCRRGAMPGEEGTTFILKTCLIQEITFLSIFAAVGAAFTYLPQQLTMRQPSANFYRLEL